jgi:hypothetical protein
LLLVCDRTWYKDWFHAVPSEFSWPHDVKAHFSSCPILNARNFFLPISFDMVWLLVTQRLLLQFVWGDYSLLFRAKESTFLPALSPLCHLVASQYLLRQMSGDSPQFPSGTTGASQLSKSSSKHRKSGEDTQKV